MAAPAGGADRTVRSWSFPGASAQRGVDIMARWRDPRGGGYNGGGVVYGYPRTYVG